MIQETLELRTRTLHKLRVRDLGGAFLSYCVARCLNEVVTISGGKVLDENGLPVEYGISTEQTEPVIREHQITAFFSHVAQFYEAKLPDPKDPSQEVVSHGSTLLQAAMRCLVAANFGQEFDLEVSYYGETLDLKALNAHEVALPLARDIQPAKALVINAPHWFADANFRFWLNNGEPKFTWHRGGTPGEWSDVVVLVDPGLEGEGADSDMPEPIWEAIVQVCRQHFKPSRDAHIMVRLTNLAC
jgi:hypothetical protein